MPKKHINEYELYNPCKHFFEKLGYIVHGEVKGLDMTATKDDILTIIELKQAFNLKLVYQAVNRQKFSNFVYVCIPRPKKTNDSNFKNMIDLLNKLEIGLITVALDSPLKYVDIWLSPSVLKTKQKSNYILKEISGRNLSLNTGGINKSKIMTAYKEKSVKIACALNKYGELSPRLMVKNYNCDTSTGAILRNNYYGWFIRRSKGIYALTSEGKKAIFTDEFKEVTEYYTQILETSDKNEI